MMPPSPALLLAALPFVAAMPAAAQFIPLDEQEATLSDSELLPGPAEDSEDAPPPGTPPAPTSLITINGDESRLPGLYGAHRAFPSRPDESAVRLMNDGRATLHNPHILKRGASSVPQGGMAEGLDAALAAYSGSWCQLRGGFITTRALGSSALFARGDGTRLLLDGVGLSTWEDYSPGIVANHEAAVSAYWLTISTQGEASPALLLRSWSRLELGDCRALTTDHESPVLDTDADATLRNVDWLAQQSVCCRLGSGARVSISQGRLQGNGLAAVHLRSALVDGAEGEPAELDLHHCTVTAGAGAVFRVNNVSAQLVLDSVTASGTDHLLLLACPGTEGSAGANGAVASLLATRCVLGGDIRAGALSSASVVLGKGTQWSGAAEGEVRLSLRAGARWKLSGNSRVAAIDFGGDAVQSGVQRIESNGFDVLYNPDEAPALKGKTYGLPGGGALKPAGAP